MSQSKDKHRTTAADFASNSEINIKANKHAGNRASTHTDNKKQTAAQESTDSFSPWQRKGKSWY